MAVTVGLRADTMVLINGKRYEVTLTRIEDGYAYFLYEGEEKKVKVRGIKELQVERADRSGHQDRGNVEFEDVEPQERRRRIVAPGAPGRRGDVGARWNDNDRHDDGALTVEEYQRRAKEFRGKRVRVRGLITETIDGMMDDYVILGGKVRCAFDNDHPCYRQAREIVLEVKRNKPREGDMEQLLDFDVEMTVEGVSTGRVGGLSKASLKNCSCVEVY